MYVRMPHADYSLLTLYRVLLVAVVVVLVLCCVCLIICYCCGKSRGGGASRPKGAQKYQNALTATKQSELAANQA